MEDDDEVCLLVPPRSCHLRAVRLVAAEAGGRAGLDVSELIVDAVTDHYAFDHDGDKLSFVVVKQGARTVTA